VYEKRRQRIRQHNETAIKESFHRLNKTYDYEGEQKLKEIKTEQKENGLWK
jgi:hypothetical protein